MRAKISFRDWLNEECKDEEFRACYEEEKSALAVALEITKLRKQQHLTQTELAKKVGTSQQAISRIERGNYEGFSYTTLAKIAEALGYIIQIKFVPTPKAS
jgi:DNA-binding XRE family transcriptional regulator